MAPLRSSRVRRFVELLLVWSFAFGAIEAPIADVHDGGAPHAEIDQVTGQSHSDHENVIGEQASDRSGTGSSDHPVHVCHCTHAHAGVLATARVELRVFERALHEAVASEVRPPAVALDPPTYPPIA